MQNEIIFVFISSEDSFYCGSKIMFGMWEDGSLEVLEKHSNICLYMIAGVSYHIRQSCVWD